MFIYGHLSQNTLYYLNYHFVICKIASIYVNEVQTQHTTLQTSIFPLLSIDGVTPSSLTHQQGTR